MQPALVSRILTIALLSYVLAGCANPAPQPTRPTNQPSGTLFPTNKAATPVIVSSLPTSLPGATPAPTLAVPPASPVIVQPTSVPTSVPPTPTLPREAYVVGPEWNIAKAGDLNGDGRFDVVAYKPASLTPRQPRTDMPLVVTEAVIVQEGTTTPELQVTIGNQRVWTPSATLASFPAGAGPAAFQLGVGDGLVALTPLNAAGDVNTLGAVVRWDAGAAAYRLAALANPTVPVAAGPALVGPEWTVAQQGDYNANGRRETVAYKAGPAMQASGYGLSASELVIVEEGLLGSAELQLALDPARLFVPGQTLVSYPAQIRPDGFAVALNTTGPVFRFAPLKADGTPLTRGAEIVWESGAGGYRPTAASELLPPKTLLVGSEWTIAADGDANGDGRRDVVAYKPAASKPTVLPYQLAATEIVVVQENAAGPYGQPEVQLAINTRRVDAPGIPLFDYANRSVAGLLLNVTPTGGAPVTFVPFTSNGQALADLAAIAVWDASQGGYRLRLGSALPAPTAVVPTLVPTPGTVPLVGPEWTILQQGDLNGDGRRDLIAYKPASIVPRNPNPGLATIVIELVIVQEGQSGPELQLGISPAQVVIPGRVLASYAPQAAGFQVGLGSGSPARITFVPLNSTGDALSPPVTLTWNASETLYVP